MPHCQSWPDQPVLPLPTDLADEPKPFWADHPPHGRHPQHFCNGTLRR